jgi:hypothetical protein
MSSVMCRVLISAYLFLTGYGHFLHFWNRGKAAGRALFSMLVYTFIFRAESYGVEVSFFIIFYLVLLRLLWQKLSDSKLKPSQKFKFLKNEKTISSAPACDCFSTVVRLNPFKFLPLCFLLSFRVLRAFFYCILLYIKRSSPLFWPPLCWFYKCPPDLPSFLISQEGCASNFSFVVFSISRDLADCFWPLSWF